MGVEPTRAASAPPRTAGIGRKLSHPPGQLQSCSAGIFGKSEPFDLQGIENWTHGGNQFGRCGQARPIAK